MDLNTTTILHFAPEKAALSLVGLVVVPLVSIIVYYIASKRVQEAQNTKSKAHLFYRMISGILIAQFIGHTYWYTTGPFWFIALFVALGYVALDVAESVARIWNKNPNYIPLDEIIEDIDLDKKSNKSNDMVVASDLASPQFAEDTFDVEDSVKDLVKRRWMLGALFFCLIVISCADGFHLVVTSISPPLLASYYVHGACLSVAVFSAMIHAKVHTARRGCGWWTLFTALWAVIYFCSALFVILGLPPQYIIVETLNHPAFVALYGFASGTLLKIQVYFHFMKSFTSDKRDLRVGILVFVVATALSMATSIYL